MKTRFPGISAGLPGGTLRGDPMSLGRKMIILLAGFLAGMLIPIPTAHVHALFASSHDVIVMEVPFLVLRGRKFIPATGTGPALCRDDLVAFGTDFRWR